MTETMAFIRLLDGLQDSAWATNDVSWSKVYEMWDSYTAKQYALDFHYRKA